MVIYLSDETTLSRKAISQRTKNQIDNSVITTDRTATSRVSKFIEFEFRVEFRVTRKRRVPALDASSSGTRLLKFIELNYAK